MSRTHSKRLLAGSVILSAVALLFGSAVAARQPARPASTAPVHAKAVKRLLIRNAMVIYGNGKPAFGPTDILVQDGLIARVGPTSPKAARETGNRIPKK